MSVDPEDLRLLTPEERDCADVLAKLGNEEQSLLVKVSLELLLRHLAAERRVARAKKRAKKRTTENR